MAHLTKAYLEPWQTSRMELFAKIKKIHKNCIIDIWQDFKYVSTYPTLLYCTLLSDVVNEENDQKNDENQNKKSFLKGKETLTFDFSLCFCIWLC